MAKVKVHIWHDANGEIMAIGRPMGDVNCVPLNIEGQSVLETDVEERYIAKLHQTHVVDLSRKLIIEISQSKVSQSAS